MTPERTTGDAAPDPGQPDAGQPGEGHLRPGLSADLVAWAERLVAAVSADRLLQHCAVFIARPGRGLVLAGQTWGAGEDTGAVVPGQWVVPFEGSVCGWVYRMGRAALLEDVTKDPDYRTYPGSQARSELAVPIIAAGVTVGVINLESPRRGTFTIADIDAVRGNADQAGAEFAEAGLAAET